MGNYPTRFPTGLGPKGVSILNMPVLNTYSNKVFWVYSGNGSDSASAGNETHPFATIDYAVGRCTANRGDIIMVKAGHAETLTGASGITCDVAGVTIQGLGTGADRPEISFGTAAGASIVVSAANVSILNIVGISAVDTLTNPFHIQAAGCTLDIEWQDPSSSLQAVRAIECTTAADNLKVNLKVAGITSGGTAPVNAIRMDGANGAIVNLDFYGRASTSVVQFVTTACSNVEVYGYIYNSGVTDGTKDVVDTIGGSTWWADIMDGSAGAKYSGGSAAALAADDVSTIASSLNVPTADVATNTLERDVIGNKTDAGVQAVTTTKSLMAYTKAILDILAGSAGVTTFPSPVIAGNAVNLAEVIRYISDSQLAVVAADSTNNVDAADVIGNKTDAGVQAVTTTVGLVAYLKGALDIIAGSTGLATWPTAAAYANGVNFAEVLGYIQDGTRRGSGTSLAANESLADVLYATNGIGTFPNAAVPANGVSIAEVLRATFNLTPGGILKNVSSVTTQNLFTVAGGVVKIVNIVGYITAAIQNQANNTKLVYTPTGGTATDVCAVLDVANAGQFGLLTITGTFANALVLTATAGIKAGIQAAPFIVTPGILSLNCAATNTGVIDWYIEYQVMDIDATVVAA